MSKEIVNRIESIHIEDVSALKERAEHDDRILLVQLDGDLIQSWDDYVSVIQEQFKFPTPCNDSIDRYEDWMRDLDWLNKDGFVLIINNYGSFLKYAEDVKSMIIDGFSEVILPFWQEDVKSVVVGGQPKPFTIYLVK